MAPAGEAPPGLPPGFAYAPQMGGGTANRGNTYGTTGAGSGNSVGY